MGRLPRMKRAARWLFGRYHVLTIAAALAWACAPKPSADARAFQAEYRRFTNTLLHALPPDRWTEVCPVQFRPWAEKQLRNRIHLAAKKLSEEAAPSEALDQALTSLPRLMQVIAETARDRCSERECLGQHLETPEVALELQVRLCPGLFPFC